MNNKTQKLNELKNSFDQLNNRNKTFPGRIGIDTKKIYCSPTIHLLGDIARKTAGSGNSNQYDIFTPNDPIS